ncbi:MAG: acyltransferase family protein [Desulfovibrionaceae bacterium]
MGPVRLLLALLVLDSHHQVLPFATLSGHEAVQVFFVLSGFYMALILDPDQGDYPGAGSFWLSRFLRLYPAYWLVLGLSLLALLGLDVHALTTRAAWLKAVNSGAGPALATLWTGILGQEWLFGLGLAPGGWLVSTPLGEGNLWHLSPVIQAWSLSLELYFYLLAPWLVRRSSRTLWLIAAASLALRLAGGLAGLNAVFLKRFFPLELWLFTAGVLSWRLYARRLAAGRAPGRAWGLAARWGLPAALLAAGALPQPWRLALLIPLACLALPGAFHACRRSRGDRFLGAVSYPFYLVHYLVIALVEEYAPDPGSAAASLVIVAGSLVLAALIHLGLERPVDRFRHRLARRRAPAPARPLLPAPQPAG